MAEPLGSLIVELRLESAKFRAEMDSARVTMRQTGESATVSSRQIARLASEGFGAIVPIGFKAERALSGLIAQMIAGKGAFAALGPPVAVLASAFGGFFAGNFIRNFLELKDTTEGLGERIKVAAGFTGGFEERLRKAAEAQKAFFTEMSKGRDILASLNLELASAQGFDTSEANRKARDANIIKQLGGADPRTKEALALSAAIQAEQTRKALEEQRKLRDENEQKVLDQLRKERDEQLKTWQTETSFLADELKTRLKLRQDFEAQLGQGGLPGQETGEASGLAAVRRFREQIQKEARDLAFLEREGLISQTDSTQAREGIRTRALDEARRLKEQFQGLPAILEAVDKAISSVEFGNLGRELATARTEIDALVPTLDSLRTGLGQFASQLVALPLAADPASAAVRQLSRDYIDLGNAIYFANAAQAALVTQ